MSTNTTVTITESELAEALFVSPLQPSQQPTEQDVKRAIWLAFQAHHLTGIAGLMAAEFGEHPDTAVSRIRWALDTLHRMTVAAETALAAAIAMAENVPFEVPSSLQAEAVAAEVASLRAMLATA